MYKSKAIRCSKKFYAKLQTLQSYRCRSFQKLYVFYEALRHFSRLLRCSEKLYALLRGCTPFFEAWCCSKKLYAQLYDVVHALRHFMKALHRSAVLYRDFQSTMMLYTAFEALRCCTKLYAVLQSSTLFKEALCSFPELYDVPRSSTLHTLRYST